MKLGLDLDATSFVKGTLAIHAIEKGLDVFKDVARELVLGLPHLVSEVAEASDKLDSLSQVAGVSTASLQQLAYAGKFSNLSMDDMAHSLQVLALHMNEARKGGEAGAAFQHLGVRVTDATGKLRKGDEVLFDLAEKFKAMPDGAEKTALAMQVLGKSGAHLIPFLNEGKEGLQELAGEISVLDEETIKMGVDFQKTQTRLSGIWGGIKKVAGAAALPIFKDLADQALSWWKANQQVIKQNVKAFIQQVAKAIQTLTRATQALFAAAQAVWRLISEGWVAIFEVLGPLVKDMWENFGTLGKVTLAVGAAFLYAWLSATAPLLVLAALVAILILLIEDVWVGLNGGKSLIKDLVTKWGEFADKWANTFDEDDNFLVKMLKEAWLWVSNFEKQWDTLVKDLSILWREYGGIVEAAVMPAYAALKEMIGFVDTILEGLDKVNPFSSHKIDADERANRNRYYQALGQVTGQNFNDQVTIGNINISVPPGAGVLEQQQLFAQSVGEYVKKQNRAARQAVK